MKTSWRLVACVLMCCLMAPAVQADDLSDKFYFGEWFLRLIDWIRATIPLDDPAQAVDQSGGGYIVPTG